MEDLQNAARAAKIEADRQHAEQQEQARTRAEREQAQRLQAERETRERAQQFLAIMRAKNVPYTGLYEGENERIIRDALGYGRREVLGPKGEPRLLGWVAIQEWRVYNQLGEWDYTEPGAFITPDGQTYECDKERGYEGVNYITRAYPNPTILAGEERWQRMARELAQWGLVD